MTKFSKWLRGFVYRCSKKITSKNIFAMVYLPFAALGFTWGYVFLILLTVASDWSNNPELPYILQFIGNHSIAVAIIPPLMITYGLIPVICRGIVLLMPDAFEEYMFDQ